MCKETHFLIWCLERYRYTKGLSGAEAAELFEKSGIYHYIKNNFEVLHAMGDRAIIEDLDEYIEEGAHAL